jgi:hypothetical protein
MFLNKEDESKLAHRVNNYLATLNLTTELALHEGDKDSILLAYSTTNELIKFWKYVNFLFRNKPLDILVDESLEKYKDFPSDLVSLLVEELFNGGLKNQATFYKLTFSEVKNSTTLTYHDNGSGFPIEIIENFGSIQKTGKNGAGLGLLVISKLASSYGIEFKLDNNSAYLVKNI